MPRPIGLNLTQIGSGRASPGTVDVSAWTNPSQGTDGLRVHVEDPSRAHMAATIGIVDAGGYYLSDEVEGALQEIGGASSEGRQNGVVTGFGYSAVGLVVTFATPSTALIPTLRDYSGDSVTLPDNTPSVWVYISASTGLIAQSVGAAPPSITAPENALLWQFTTLGGVITAARDARLYVRNLDRKLPFTVRSQGTQANQESEACFVTLDAALTYLIYSTALSTRRTTVIVRGAVTTAPINIPVAGVHFRGEDGAIITLTSGAYLFDLQGQDGVTFSDLVFQTDVVGATAIVDTVGSASTLTVSRCVFTGGANPWQNGVVLATATGQVTVSGCQINATDVGVASDVPNGVLVDDTAVTAVNFVAGSVGIRVGSSPTTVNEVAGTVRACSVVGFDTGISVSGNGHVVAGCNVVPGVGGAVGILVDGPSVGAVVSGCSVDCSQNGGLIGIDLFGKATDRVIGTKVVDNTVYGAVTYGVRLYGPVQDAVVKGNFVDCNVPASPNDPSAIAGIYLTAVGPDAPSYTTIVGNTLKRSRTGIYMRGLPTSATSLITEAVVSGNEIHHCAVGIAGVPAAIGDTSIGIGVEWGIGLNISGNNVYGIGRILTDAGTVVFPTPANVYSVGIVTQDCRNVSVATNQVRLHYVRGTGTSTGIWWYGTGSTASVIATGVMVSDNAVDSVPGYGILLTVGTVLSAASRTLRGAQVCGNTASACDTGIRVESYDQGTVNALLVGNNIVSSSKDTGVVVVALDAATTPGVIDGMQLVDNTVTNSGLRGIIVQCEDNATLTNVAVERNALRVVNDDPGIELLAGTSLNAGAAQFEYVSVSGNRIEMTAGTSTAAAIQISTVAATVNDLRVSGNDISNAYDGIEFTMIGPNNPTTDTTVTDMVVSGNSITSTRRGIYGDVTGFVDRYTANDNVVDAVDFTHHLNVAATVLSSAANRGITLSRNRLRVDPAGANTHIKSTNAKVIDLRVEDNVFVGAGVGSNAALFVDVVGSGSGTVPAIRDLHIRRNTFQDVAVRGISIDVGSAATDPIVDMSISDNTFSFVCQDASITRGSVIRCDFYAVVKNLAICGNQFVAFGHSTADHGGIDITIQDAIGLTVSDNQFNIASGASSASYGNVIIIEPKATGNLKDVSVCRNKARGVIVPTTAAREALIGIESSGGFSLVENLTVSDNDLERVDNGTGNTEGIGIRLDTNLAYRVACERNRVMGADGGTPISKAAIYMSFNSGVDGLSVVGNMVGGDSTLGAQGTGINVLMNSSSYSVRVSDNSIIGDDNTPGQGLSIATAPAGVTVTDLNVDRNHVNGYDDNIVVEIANGSNVSVCGNQTTGHSNAGITIHGTQTAPLIANTAFRNLIVDDNSVATTDTGQTYFIDIQMTDILPIHGMSVSGNSLQFRQTGLTTRTTGDGIHIQVGATGNTALENACICRNNIRSVEDGILVESGDTLCVRIDDNDIRRVLLGIKHTVDASLVDYSVSRNAVEAFDDSTRDALIHVTHTTEGQTFHKVTIDDNNIGGAISNGGGGFGGRRAILVGDVSPLGIPTVVAPNVRSASVSGNQIRSTSRGIDLYVLSSSSLSVDRNNVSNVVEIGIRVTQFGTNPGDLLDTSIGHNSVTQWNDGGGAVVSNAAYSFVSAGTVGVDEVRNLTAVANTCHSTNTNSRGWYINFVSDCRTFIFSSNAVSFPGGSVGTLAMDLNTGAGTYRNFVFTGNVFRGSANGITYASTGGIPSQCTFMGNIGDSAAASWSQLAALWTNVLPPAGAGAGQFQTLNIDNGT